MQRSKLRLAGSGLAVALIAATASALGGTAPATAAATDCTTATVPAGYLRASAEPDTMVRPSRASIFARRGATVVRSSLAPRGTPGNTRLLLQASFPSAVWNTSGACTVPRGGE